MDKVICLMGPTASGKTEIAYALSQHLPVELISVDSAQIYRGMNIGTAKPEPELLKQQPQYLIDIRDINEAYSAANFCEDAHALCEAIIARGHIPLLVGGTMMYFRAFQQGLAMLPSANQSVRTTILQDATVYGWPYLHQKLQAVDAIAASRIHPHDAQRIQRALEVFYTTGQPISAFLGGASPSPYQFINLVLFPQRRAWLHERISKRFDKMITDGFLNEVENLQNNTCLTSDMPAMRSVGYRQALAYLQGLIDYQTFFDKALAATRNLAKRQLTWLRTWPEAQQFDPEDVRCLQKIFEYLKKEGIHNESNQS